MREFYVSIYSVRYCNRPIMETGIGVKLRKRQITIDILCKLFWFILCGAYYIDCFCEITMVFRFLFRSHLW